MNNIGQRIKDLRKKNNLTQEKLADFLGVTYQSVSKWETGTSMPDIGIIVPLARVLQVSADELLGMKPIEQDERKAYFDAEYFEFWKKDHEADLEIARQAVAEYPGDYRYIHWLASNEWYVGYSDKYAGTETETELIHASVKHHKIVLEHSTDPELRNSSICGLMWAHIALKQYDEAKKYAQMYPEEPGTSRDELLAYCLRGEEAVLLRKKIVKNTLLKLCIALSNLWEYVPEPDTEAMNAEETVIKTVISDGNYQHFHIILCLLERERAKIAIKNGEADGAMDSLTKAMTHAVEFENVLARGIEEYTCPVLSGYIEDRSDARKDEWDLIEDMKEYMEKSVFDPLRNREDFLKLLK